MEAKDLFNSQQIIEPCFTNEGLSLIKILKQINVNSVIASKNDCEEKRKNAIKIIIDLTGKVIPELQEILKDDLSKKLADSKLILKHFNNKNKNDAINSIKEIQRNLIKM